MWRSSLPVLLAALAVIPMHTAQTAVDAVRFGHAGVSRAELEPEPVAVRVASLGEQVMVSDFLWVRVVLHFSDLVDSPEEGGRRWLFPMLETVIECDSRWRTSYFYGGSMLRVLGQIDSSDHVYAQGMAAFPEDPFFPFSLGMNAYLYRDDVHAAFQYLDQAARLPGAPPWYRAAAASFLTNRGQRQSAIKYLDGQLAQESRSQVRSVLQDKRRELIHDELSSQLQQRRQRWEADHGRALPGLDLLGVLPADPYGEHWVLAPDGVIRSSFVDRKVAHRAVIDERAMLLRHGGAG